MGPNESLLRCMLKLPPEGMWDLNSEDRAAIQWALDRISTLETDLKQMRELYHAASNQACHWRDRVQDIAALATSQLKTAPPNVP